MSSPPETHLASLTLSTDPSDPPTTTDSPPSPELFRERLNSLRLDRIKSIEAFESTQWEMIPFDKSSNELDPQLVVGKQLVFPRDEGKIVRAHSRNFWVEQEGSGKKVVGWQVQLQGFHHATDEEDAEDPQAFDPYTLNTSSRWDTLFEDHAHNRYLQSPTAHQSAPTDPSTEVTPILIVDASYGRKVDPDGQEAVGFGLKWGEPGSVGKEEWAWIWGELSEIEEDEEEEEEEEEEEGEKEVKEDREEIKRYKSVHLLKLSGEEEGEEKGGEQGVGLVNEKGEGIVDATE